MPRLCVIDIAGLSGRLLAGMDGLWLAGLTTGPAPMQATFPAITASVQASMTTGVEPGVHGIIAGGIYRRQCRMVSVSELSNTLLNKKRFWHSRRLPHRPRTALVFWANPLAGGADAVIGACSCRHVPGELPSVPTGLYEQIRQAIGPFDCSLIQGPDASWQASRWISAAAAHVWKSLRPELQWVYLPGVDFELVRHGLASPQAQAAMRSVDSLARELAETVRQDGGETLIVSDGGYVDVERVARPNLFLRRAGLLELRSGDEGDVPDLERSRAFALVDHQVAHIYAVDEQAAGQAAEAVAADPAVSTVVPREKLFCRGLGHDRAGEMVAIAAHDAWCAYQWWDGPQEAPALARLTGDGRKCGHDPCELFGAGEGAINPDPTLIRASRGLADVDAQDQCLFAATCRLPSTPRRVTDIPDLVRRFLFEAVSVG